MKIAELVVVDTVFILKLCHNYVMTWRHQYLKKLYLEYLKRYLVETFWDCIFFITDSILGSVSDTDFHAIPGYRCVQQSNAELTKIFVIVSGGINDLSCYFGSAVCRTAATWNNVTCHALAIKINYIYN